MARIFCPLLVAVVSSSMALQLMTPSQTEGSATLAMPKQAPSKLPTYCQPENLIVFKAGGVRYSNLGSQGPDTSAPPFLVYGDVTPSGNDEQVIDLQIRVSQGDYMALNPRMNGMLGSYGIINVAANTTVDLTFRFIDRITGIAVPLQHPFIFSFFDLDTNGINDTAESISVSGFHMYNLTNGSEVNVAMASHNAAVFKGTALGNRADNPTHPLGLTKAQMHRTFSLEFRTNTSEFNVTLHTDTNSTGPMAARNFMFAGPSTIVCPGRGLCSTFKCPRGFDPRPDAAYIACAGEKCSQENDTGTCCCSADAVSYAFDKIFYPQAFADGDLPELFPDMAPGLNRLIDMTLKNTSTYISVNGTIHHWSFGKINMAGNSSVNFTFAFTDRGTEKPFSLPPFRVSFFDLDDGPSYACDERLSIESLDSYTLSDYTSIQVTKKSGMTTFATGELGDGADNPAGYPLTASQRAREVVVTFPSTSNFSITLATGPNCTTGRNIMFSRPAAIGYCRA
jgi:hypothetical protein